MHRICHVQVMPLLSGAQRSMLEIIGQLDRQVYAPHVVCGGHGPLTDELRRRRVPCHVVRSLGRPLRPHRDLRAYQQLRRLFARERFALVHTHSSKSGVLGRVAAHRAGVPRIVHHVRGFAFHEFSRPAEQWAYSRMEKWAGRYCDRVIFVNHEERELAIRRGWLPEEKCLTIYNGTNLDALSPARRRDLAVDFRRRHRLADEAFIILVAGRLDRQKQPLILPAIAARLEAIRPHMPWRMVVAGDGPLRSGLADSVHRAALGHRVELVGWLDDNVAAFHAADVVLLPSLWEGLPRVLIEAQAAGRPTVASQIKGNREAITDATGILCDPVNADAYARALARLAGDTELRATMGRAARRRAEAHFDTVANNRRITALYDELLRAAPPCARRRRAA